jgi:hypothetical protein
MGGCVMPQGGGCRGGSMAELSYSRNGTAVVCQRRCHSAAELVHHESVVESREICHVVTGLS